MDKQLQAQVLAFLVAFGNDYAPNYSEMAQYRTTAKALAAQLQVAK